MDSDKPALYLQDEALIHSGKWWQYKNLLRSVLQSMLSEYLG